MLLYNRYTPFIRAVPFLLGLLIAYDVNKQIPLLTILFLDSGRIILTIYRHNHRWREMSDITSDGL